MGGLTVSLSRFLFIILTIVVLIAVAVFMGTGQNMPAVVAASFLATMLRVATPLTLGALSGIYCERAGVVNIAIEGMMLTAAFFGWLGSIYLNQAGAPVIVALLGGAAAAVLTGASWRLLHAVLSVTFKVDQIISGTVINILAVGLTGFLNRALFFQQDVPHAPGVLPPSTSLPGRPAGDRPGLPAAAHRHHRRPAGAVHPLGALLHPLGSAHPSRGRAPPGGGHRGINVYKMRYMNVIIGGMIAGLAGAYFTIESVPSFEPGQTAGRGFISLAAMIFGGWTPFGAWAAALLFGAAQALQINAQYFGIPAPLNSWRALPYLLTMIALSGIVGRTTAPAADGQPYEK